MAEAVAAFGVAANVIQFIDFGCKLMTRLWQFYKSSRDNYESLPDVQRLTALLDMLKTVNIPKNEENELDDGLQQLVLECHNVATDLLKLLNTLQNDNRRKREAMKAAFKLMWREDELLSLQKRLDQCKAQMIIHLLASLRYVQSRNPDELLYHFILIE